MNFGSYIKARRIELGYTLRRFSAEKGLDAAYLSRMENSLTPAPVDSDKVKAIGIALALESQSSEWVEFFDLATASRYEIPEDLRQNPIVPRLLPAFFRSIRDDALTEEQIAMIEQILLGGDGHVGSSDSSLHHSTLSQ